MFDVFCSKQDLIEIILLNLFQGGSDHESRLCESDAEAG